MPLFSVIIPLYNKEKYIEATIRSVLKQTVTDYEIIIVNDGSTDNSLKLIKRFDVSNIIIINQENKGLSAARNKGISQAKGEFIALLDADDVWLPNYLKTIKSLYYLFPEVSIYGTDYYEKRGAQLLTTNKNISPELKGQSFIIEDFFKANFYQFIPCQSSIVFKASRFNNPVFDETLTYGEDVDFYLKYCFKHKVGFCNKPLATVNSGLLDQMTNTIIANKKTPDLDYYQKKYINHPSILKYIDIQRYKYAVKYITQNNKDLKHTIIKKIDQKKHLSFKQRIMLRLPRVILLFFRSIKIFLLRFKLRITT